MMDTKEALEKSIVMWDWLADNPVNTKSDALSACFPNEDPPLFDCFLCESVRTQAVLVQEPFPIQKARPDCTKCPVWPAEGRYDFYRCEKEDGAPYIRWWRGGRYCGDDMFADFPSRRLALRKRREAAKEVADLCRAALEKM